jgi:hypothetical protein
MGWYELFNNYLKYSSSENASESGSADLSRYQWHFIVWCVALIYNVLTDFLHNQLHQQTKINLQKSKFSG